MQGPHALIDSYKQKKARNDKEYDNVVLMGQYLFIPITMVICISRKQLLLMVRIPITMVMCITMGNGYGKEDTYVLSFGGFS